MTEDLHEHVRNPFPSYKRMKVLESDLKILLGWIMNFGKVANDVDRQRVDLLQGMKTVRSIFITNAPLLDFDGVGAMDLELPSQDVTGHFSDEEP